MKAKFHWFIAGLTILTTVIVTGCSGVYPDRYLTHKREIMVSQGKPPAYVDGYMDGCASGMCMAGDKQFKYIKNLERMESDALYARGWDDGQICCRNERLLEQQQAALEQTQGVDMSQERHRRIQERTKADEAEIREIWDQLKK